MSNEVHTQEELLQKLIMNPEAIVDEVNQAIGLSDSTTVLKVLKTTLSEGYGDLIVELIASLDWESLEKLVLKEDKKFVNGKLFLEIHKTDNEDLMKVFIDRFSGSDLQERMYRFFADQAINLKSLNPEMSWAVLKHLFTLVEPSSLSISNRHLVQIASRKDAKMLSYLIENGIATDAPVFGNRDTPPNFNSPLAVAASKGSYECAKLLLQSGVDFKSKGNILAIPIAAGNGEVNLLKLLVEAAPFNMKKISRYRNSSYIDSPLGEAVKNGNIECVIYLIEAGCPINESLDCRKPSDYPNPPVHLAMREGHVEVVRLLVNHGAELYLSKQLYPHHFKVTSFNPKTIAENCKNEDMVRCINELID